MLAAYATCDDYPHNAYPWRFLNFKIYCCLGVHAGIILYVYKTERGVEAQRTNPNFEYVWEKVGPVPPIG